jgi:putative transposase
LTAAQNKNIVLGDREPLMPRQARTVVPGLPHHIVQRGNRRQRTFFSPADYLAYLRIAAEAFSAARVDVWAYCLMPNHVHLIAAPADVQGLAVAMGRTHQAYTRRVNHREEWSGLLWEGRFKSFPMDERYALACARYVAQNPVRAGLVAQATDWPWSSVRGHLECAGDPLLNPEPLAALAYGGLAELFAGTVAEDELRAIRAATFAGRLPKRPGDTHAPQTPAQHGF